MCRRRNRLCQSGVDRTAGPRRGRNRRGRNDRQNRAGLRRRAAGTGCRTRSPRRRLDHLYTAEPRRTRPCRARAVGRAVTAAASGNAADQLSSIHRRDFSLTIGLMLVLAGSATHGIFSSRRGSTRPPRGDSGVGVRRPFRYRFDAVSPVGQPPRLCSTPSPLPPNEWIIAPSTRPFFGPDGRAIVLPAPRPRIADGLGRSRRMN